MGVKTAGVGHFQIPTAPAAGTSVTSGAANTYTASAVQLIASTAAALYITGVHIEAAAASAATYKSVQIMIGAGGSETILGQYLVCMSTASTSALGFRAIFPPIPVASGQRLSAKVADSVGSQAVLVSLECIAQSNVVDDGIAITTVTTVTNQLTSAQIATGVWQDTTAGDFTAANSIGKSVMNGVALGTGLTINAYTGNTVQTGDAFARLGAPSGASVSADVAAVKTDTVAVKASQVLATGTATSGAAATITLQTALGADTLPVGCLIAITGGTGIGQARIITGYVNSSKVATVGHNWTTNPDATSVYYIIYNDAPKVDSSLKVAGVVLTDTITTYTGNTVQTGDSFLVVKSGGTGDNAAIKAKTDNLPAAPASTTNITSGTITTVTNLTNAPTAGDLTATMKTSVTTAATAATPVAASVTGAVGSVTGNVGGNVTGSVGSVVGAVGSVASAVTVGTNSDKTGYSLTTAYDLAKTASQAGDAMTLTSGERTSIGTAVWATGTRTLSSFGTLVTDMVTAVWAAATRTLTAIGFAVDTNANATETAIKAKTDQLAFTVASQVDANIQSVNDATVTGDGNTGTEWGP
jgi:hypothetical protein